jgi:hypothetical protein
MAETRFSEWQPLYLQAILAPLGSPELPQRVNETERAISQRLQELRASSNGNEERQGIADALRSLRYLKNEHFKQSTGFGSQQVGPE